ncbi:hypothetical protein [Bacillus sp. V59.32b]|nr:hypothetical protein [Bacillus sp. V59.32b]
MNCKKNSSQIIPVLEGIVVVPLLGKYDENWSEELIAKTLNNQSQVSGP